MKKYVIHITFDEKDTILLALKVLSCELDVDVSFLIAEFENLDGDKK